MVVHTTLEDLIIQIHSVVELPAGGAFGESQPAQSTPNFGRDESPFGNSNPMDISDDDLPF